IPATPPATARRSASAISAGVSSSIIARHPSGGDRRRQRDRQRSADARLNNDQTAHFLLTCRISMLSGTFISGHKQLENLDFRSVRRLGMDPANFPRVSAAALAVGV